MFFKKKVDWRSLVNKKWSIIYDEKMSFKEDIL